MPYFSVCFSYKSISTRIGSHLFFWCRGRGYSDPVQVKKLQRIVTLVQAETAEEAIAIRQKSHPQLFQDATYEVIEVVSPEKWSSHPDCTFKFPPAATIVNFFGGGHLQLELCPTAKEAFERLRWTFGGIEWRPA